MRINNKYLLIIRIDRTTHVWIKPINKTIELNTSRIKLRVRRKLSSLVDHVSFRTIYLEKFSRDCDLYEVNNVSKFKNIYEANNYLEHWYDSAEGHQWHSRISKEEYEEFESSSRDRAAEMMGY